MPYKFRVWCPSCLNEDFQGGFGGGWELSDETFQTIEDAIKAADRFLRAPTDFLPLMDDASKETFENLVVDDYLKRVTCNV